MLGHIADHAFELVLDGTEDISNGSLLNLLVVLKRSLFLRLLGWESSISTALRPLALRAFIDMVLINVTFHDFTVESQRILLSDLIGQLAFLGLDDVSVGDADDVGDSVVLLVCLVLGLLGQETFVCESCLNLLPEASCWRLVLRRVLIELAHLLIELVHLLIAHFVAVHEGLARSWHWAVRLSGRVA